MARKKVASKGPKMVTPSIPDGYVPMAYQSGKFYGNVEQSQARALEAQGLVRLEQPPEVPAE